MTTIVRETDNYIYCLCPQHKDTKPSLVVAKTGPFAGMFYCFGCGYRGWAVNLGLEFIMYPHAIKPPQDWVKWQNRVHKTTPDIAMRQTELAREWNVNDLVLHRLGYGWDTEAHTFPMFNENSEIIGIQRRYPNGRKVCVEGSRLGLFVPEEWPVTRNTRNLLLITEGVSDCAVALDMGFPAIGRPCASCGERLVEGWLVGRRYSSKLIKWVAKILVIADNDEIGKESAMNLQKILNGWSCDVFIPPAKDLRQAVINFGKEKIRGMLEDFVR